MSLIMRKLAMYERQKTADDVKKKNQGCMSNPADEELRRNITMVLKKLRETFKEEKDNPYAN